MSRTSTSALAVAPRYLLTPTMTSSPRSMRAWRRAAASSMRSLGMPASTALVMPPIASTSSIDRARRVREACVSALDVIAAAQRIDDVGHRLSCCEDELRVAGDARAKTASAARSPRRRNWCAAIACRPAPPPSPRSRCARCCCRGPARSATRRRSGNACAARGSPGSSAPNCRHDLRPQKRAARSFATSMKKFMPMPKKNDSRGANSSTARPLRQRRAHIFDAVGQREGQLLHAGRARFLHVIAGDRDRIEFRHVLRGVFDDVGDDAHRRLRADRYRCCGP